MGNLFVSISEWPLWKKIACLAAVILVVGGIGYVVYAGKGAKKDAKNDVKQGTLEEAPQPMPTDTTNPDDPGAEGAVVGADGTATDQNMDGSLPVNEETGAVDGSTMVTPEEQRMRNIAREEIEAVLAERNITGSNSTTYVEDAIEALQADVEGLKNGSYATARQMDNEAAAQASANNANPQNEGSTLSKEDIAKIANLAVSSVQKKIESGEIKVTGSSNASTSGNSTSSGMDQTAKKEIIDSIKKDIENDLSSLKTQQTNTANKLDNLITDYNKAVDDINNNFSSMK